MKRYISLALIFLIIASLLVPGAAMAAGSSDLRIVMEQLDDLSDSKKAAFISSLWNTAVIEIGDGNPVTVDGVYEKMRIAMGDSTWNSLVGDGSDKIFPSSVKIIIQRLLNNKSLVISYYNSYKDLLQSNEIKAFFGLGSGATAGEVMVKVQPYFEGCITKDSTDTFIRNGNVSTRIANKLGALPDSLIMDILEQLLGGINYKIDQLAVKVNNSVGAYGLTTDDAIFALSVFGFYSEPSTGGDGTSVTNTGYTVTKNNVETTIAFTSKALSSKGTALLPASVIKEAWDGGAVNITIQMPDASVKIPSGALTLSGDEDIEITARKVSTDELSQELLEQIGDSLVFEFELKIDGNVVRDFNSAIEVSVPYSPKPGEDPEKVTVFYIKFKDDGTIELVNMSGVYDSETGRVRFTTTHFSMFAVKVNNVTFNDIGQQEWARKYIEVMASKGILNGKGSGIYSPSADLTRAEFAAMVVRVLKLTGEEAHAVFSDVKQGSWYYSTVNIAAKWGLVSGRPDGTFAPDDKITRQDMAVILANALQKVMKKDTSGASIDHFGDKMNISSYARNSVGLAAKYHLINGRTDNNFAPKDNTNRAEAAAVIYRLFNID